MCTDSDLNGVRLVLVYEHVAVIFSLFSSQTSFSSAIFLSHHLTVYFRLPFVCSADEIRSTNMCENIRHNNKAFAMEMNIFAKKSSTKREREGESGPKTKSERQTKPNQC